jgi:hypothetical protein
MEYPILLIGNLVALLAAAIALGTPRINAAIARRNDGVERELAELDAFALRVRALSKQIQEDLTFPHLPTLGTVAPVHDLIYASPTLNPDVESLSEMLQVGQRARELNFGPKELLLWPFRSAMRKVLIQELVQAETRFAANYWIGRSELSSPRGWIGKIRRRMSELGSRRSGVDNSKERSTGRLRTMAR